VVGAVDADHQVIVGRDSDDHRLDDLRSRARVIPMESLVRHVDPVADARTLAALVNEMRAVRPDVVHTHQAKGGLIGRVAARSTRVPTVFHSASMASFGPGYGARESRAFAAAERATAPLVDRYFVVGHDLADRLAANGVARERLEVIRSSLDLRPFTPPTTTDRTDARQHLGLVPDAPLLCYVGSLDDRKGVAGLGPLLEYVRRLTGHDVRLVVAGDGPQRPDLEASAAATLGPGIAVFLGHVAHVSEVMRAADALVLPSAAEGLPQVLVQAAACHLPFAAFDVDGVAEMQALGATGTAIELGDHRGLALAAVGALAQGRADRSAGIARDRLTQWSPAEVAGSYARAYRAGR
jgi:glycosyltransferase involved in cell wall biosynthesis